MTDLNDHSTQLASATIYKYFARSCPKTIRTILKRRRALHRFVQTLKSPAGRARFTRFSYGDDCHNLMTGGG